MLIIRCVFVLTIALTAVSCSKKSAASGSDTTANRPGGISAKEAAEQEQFIDGCIQKSLGNYKQALDIFVSVIDKNPNNGAAQYEAADLCYLLNEPDRALVYSKAAARLQPSNRWFQLRYAEMLEANGQYAGAAAVYKTMGQQELEDVDLRYRQARSLVKNNSLGDALKVYDIIAQQFGWTDSLCASKIAVYRKQGDVDGITNTWKSISAAYPKDQRYPLALAKHYESIGNNELAQQQYLMVAELDATAAGPRLLLATDKRKTDPTAAFQIAVNAFQLAGHDTVKHEYLFRHYLNDSTLRNWTKVDQQEVDSLTRIMLRVNSTSAHAHLARGHYFFALKEYPKARPYVKQTIALGMTGWDVWLMLLQANNAMNDNTSQQQDSEQALSLYPTQPVAYLYSARALRISGKYKQAVSIAETGIGFVVNDSMTQLELQKELFFSALGAEQFAQSDKQAESLLAGNTKLNDVKFAYAWSLQQRNILLVKATTYTNQLLQEEPDNADYIVLAGRIKYRNAEFDAAIQQADKALSKSSNHPPALELKGDCYYRKNQPDKALAEWKKSQAAGNNSVQLQRKISSGTLLTNE
jgi:tetratricopeptide (TPR) repeat protein